MLRFPPLLTLSIGLLMGSAYNTVSAQPAKQSELEKHYAGLAEFTSFPFIADFIEKEPKRTRADVVKLAQDESAAIKKEGQDYKPLWAEIAENDLSHLLGWMSASSSLSLKAMAVYTRQGLLVGVAAKTAGVNPQQQIPADQLMTVIPLSLDDATLAELEAKISMNKDPAVASFTLVKENISDKHPGLMKEFLDIKNSKDEVVGFAVYLMGHGK
ncbi:MAG: hypothetical protein ACK5O7_02755 [Holosporales bacterium]